MGIMPLTRHSLHGNLRRQSDRAMEFSQLFFLSFFFSFFPLLCLALGSIRHYWAEVLSILSLSKVLMQDDDPRIY